ncbi:DUF3833 domain-containing protein [Rhodobacter sp. NTK016B]|uniref:DUF3833 domain-containing protein n=1 Tax=Rhodobacter sp. NTK016B TaxID=2759676 RepID=UPI001A8F2CCF|nr:DUF3833 domain-containing protein [Rhodobacter sp. NTK016B]MBN8291973.1 DUF3833 domain-containing protein [Rhodobacter sp. NTK016B]
MTEILLALAAVAVLTLVARNFIGFTAQRPAHYATQQPQFDLRHHLDGPLLCEGVIYGPLGRVNSRFVADMQGRWEGNRGVLDEHFRYSSGETQIRQWRLTLANDGDIRAEADDLADPGRGRQEGAALQLCYRIRLPEKAGGWVLDVTDWMYLTDNGTIINRSQFRKFGIKVAELVATMRRVPA